jgi:hypothetical protein
MVLYIQQPEENRKKTGGNEGWSKRCKNKMCVENSHHRDNKKMYCECGTFNTY